MATSWVKTVDSDYYPEWSLMEDHDGMVARELVGTVYRNPHGEWVALDRANDVLGRMATKAEAKALAEAAYEDSQERARQARIEGGA